jgi:hypothetical protein
MSLIEKNREPSASELKWFGLLFALFFTAAGMLIWWRTGSHRPLVVLATIGCLVAVIYYSLPPLRRTIYLVWMALVYPIGWVVTHVLLLFTYYLVLTPIGLIMRAMGRDPMQRQFEREAATYWVEHDPAADSKRYFRQF